MTRARQRDEWSRASAVLAMIANAHRDAKRKPRPYRPADFDPFVAAARRRPIASVEELARGIIASTGGRHGGR